jgi:hypothetical protein
MTQPSRVTRSFRFPLVLRHVTADRKRLARAVLPDVGGHDQTWWELVDAAADDARPPATIAVTGPVVRDGSVALLAAVGEGEAALTQLVDALTVALRATAAATVVAAASCDDRLSAVLLRAGFCRVPSPGSNQHAELRLEL